MRILFFCLCILSLPLILDCHAKRPANFKRLDTIRLRRPIALELVDGGKRLLVANRDSGTIAIINTIDLKVLSEKRIGRKLSAMAVARKGELVLVTDEIANELIVLKRKGASLQELGRQKTGVAPVSVSVASNGRLAIVACLWSRQLLFFDFSTSVIGHSSLDLPFAPRLQLAVGKSKLIVADSFGGKLALVNVNRKKVESLRSLPVHNIRGLAFGRRHKSILVSHQEIFATGRPTPGEIRSSNLIVNQVRRLDLQNVINPMGYLMRGEERYSLGDVVKGAGDPADVYEADDGSLLVALAGVNEFTIGKPKQALWIRLAVGRRPTSFAVDKAKQRVYVANTFSDSISVVDLRKRRVIAEILLADHPRRTDLQSVSPGTDFKSVLRPEERGEMLFYDARLSFESWFSCHSCHSDGHTNGRLNDNRTDGSFGTPKRVLSLLGVNDTPKWAWRGNMESLHSQIRLSLTSTMQGKAPKAEIVRDLAAYLRTLAAPPSVARARKSIRGLAVARGEKVFKKLRCFTCHKPPTYTTPKTYDVGLRDEAGAKRFNPPSLRGISQAGPYFHDNRARTLEDVFTQYRHRLPSPLPKQELNDLLHFLRSL